MKNRRLLCISVEGVQIKPKVQMSYFLPFFTVAPIRNAVASLKYLGDVSPAVFSLGTPAAAGFASLSLLQILQSAVWAQYHLHEASKG